MIAGFSIAVLAGPMVGLLVTGAIAGVLAGLLGVVNLPAAIVLFSMSVLTAPYGAKLAHILKPPKLKLAFAAFLFISAVRMLWKALA